MEQLIALQGEVTIGKACEFRDLLCSKLQDANRLVIDVSGLTEIDLPGLQLFCSAHRTFTKRGGEVLLKGAPPDSVQSAIRLSGFVCESSCLPDQDAQCLWGKWRKR